MLPPPGPVEAALLADLAPAFHARGVPTPSGPLRVIEGGAGAPLVLLHGRGSAATTWAPLLPRLARSHRVLAVDLPGFGASRGHRLTAPDPESALRFFVDPLEAWLLAEGLASPAIVGHSLGGLCALELALRARVSPRALVLIAPMGVGPEISAAARLFFLAGPERLARALGPARFAALLGSTSPALSHELHAVAGGRPDAARAFMALVPLLGPVLHRRDRLAAIDAPALVIGGDRDEVFPAPLALGASALLPRGEIFIAPSGHAPHLDPDLEARARVIDRIEAFLRARA